MKKYKIKSMYYAYSKKQGTILKSSIIEKDLTLDEAIAYSKQHLGNVNGVMEWETKGFLYPNKYKIY